MAHTFIKPWCGKLDFCVLAESTGKKKGHCKCVLNDVFKSLVEYEVKTYANPFRFSVFSRTFFFTIIYEKHYGMADSTDKKARKKSLTSKPCQYYDRNKSSAEIFQDLSDVLSLRENLIALQVSEETIEKYETLKRTYENYQTYPFFSNLNLHEIPDFRFKPLELKDLTLFPKYIPLADQSCAKNRKNCFECLADAAHLCKNSDVRPFIGAAGDSFHNLRIFISETMGFGVEAAQDIQAGSCVGVYTGVVIREKDLFIRTNDVMFAVDYVNGHILDAQIEGSYMRFLNHHCKPNCTFTKWYIDGRLTIAIFTRQNLPKGTELTIKYGKKYLEKMKCKCTKCLPRT